MATFSVYADVLDYLQNATAAVETATLVGGNAQLSAAATLGAVTLSIFSANGAAFGATFPLHAWLLDGPNGEVVSITALISGTVTLATPTLAAHGAGVNLVSAGTLGCLADTLVRASRQVERICHQGSTGTPDLSLYAKPRSELYRGPSLRCAFDVDNTLLIRPYHFPVQAVTSVQVQMGANAPVTLATTYQALPYGGATVEIPYAQVQGQAAAINFLSRPFSRALGHYVTLGYTGGPCLTASLADVPQQIRQATFHLTTDLLSNRLNPQGAANVHRGDFSFDARMRGDTSGKSINVLDAEHELQEYMTPVGF